ncbi:hypothetical protein [Cohnella faecalis]|uniref:hypothetical protein n=1 Tax=Cohnella faecalis TaxID=2315694 RepID=UPI001F2DD6FB|nr:hypothetical protein [Cohnella faecalis]
MPFDYGKTREMTIGKAKTNTIHTLTELGKNKNERELGKRSQHVADRVDRQLDGASLPALHLQPTNHHAEAERGVELG